MEWCWLLACSLGLPQLWVKGGPVSAHSKAGMGLPGWGAQSEVPRDCWNRLRGPQARREAEAVWFSDPWAPQAPLDAMEELSGGPAGWT